MSSLASTTAPSPFPIPESSPKPTRRSLKSRVRAAIVLGVITSFAGVQPLAYVYTLWSATALLPRNSIYGVAAPPTSKLHFALLSYFLVETIFGIIYHILAFTVSRRRPDLGKDPKSLRNVVRTVLASGMGEPSSPSLSSCSSAASSRRNSIAEGSSLRMRGKSMSLDSGYGSDSSDHSGKSSLQPVFEDDEGSADSFSFLSTKLEKDDPRAIDFREASRHWFHGASISSLCRDDVKQWISWSLYGLPLEDVVKERRASVSQGIDISTLPQDENLGRDKLETVETTANLWEARAATKLPEGKSGNKVIRLTLDRVRVLSRPLALYGLIWVAQQVYRFALRKWGFEERVYGGMKYYIRIPKGWKADRASEEKLRPLVFLHGLGIGPVQYAPILNTMIHAKAYAERPLAILVQPHLSMSLFNPRYLNPPCAEESSASIVEMSKANGFDKSGITVLSHSNGTIVHGWLLKAAPELVERSCLVDPVCFALWEPSLPYNFLYAAAKSPMQLLMRYFVARELGVANTLQRNFDWISSLLQPTDIPNLGDASKASVFLSERDAIVDTPRISTYLAAEGMDESAGLKIFAKQKHGESMMGHGESFRTVMSWVRNEA